ncbi:basic form of pathogenesis-related protein 1-like [Hevea brasiliensis]|nr:basic form of pathogenesis-related protein 1-like [Hevea brasiliensis]
MTLMFRKFLLATHLVGLSLAQITLAQNSPQDYVDAHNAVRAEVGVGPVSWNKTVAAYAQKYANSRIENCELEHSYGPYGENIAEGYGNLNGVDAVTMWASEKPNYDYKSNSCVGDECLHYTQIVWRNSVHLGCGRAKCKNGWWFVTCNYDPVGNIEGQYPY